MFAVGYHALPAHTFDSLENFILENRKETRDGSEAWEFLTLSVKHGIKVISAKNYVGLITMNDGTTIEILPKLDNAEEKDTLRVFREMLKTVRDLPYKSFKKSNVLSEKMTLFEIFIRMFLEETGKLIKMGLKSGYVMQSNNENSLKGRLDFNQQIRRNLTHKEKFYVSYDEFISDRPENKLIKSTLMYMQQKSHDARNRRDCRRYLAAFADVEESHNYDNDFAKCTANRNMQEYETILKWCRIFLMNKSFTVFKGSDVAFALLFPMEQLFESYVADRLVRYMDKSQYTVSTQDRKYHLFDSPKKFALRPDIVVTNHVSRENVVLDTKWKMLSPQYMNYGISQGDMYQMYIYHKKYCPKRVLLIYPYNKTFSDCTQIMSYEAETMEGNGVKVEAILFDLMDIQGSLQRIVRQMDL